MKRSNITIRVGRNTLSFTAVESIPAPEAGGQPVETIVHEPYVVRSGVSIAANLREAFKTSDLLAIDVNRVRLVVDTPVLMIPIEQFEERSMKAFYVHAYPEMGQSQIHYNVLPDLNAVAVFSINSDLKLVVDDHYQNVASYYALTYMWRHLHQRSFTGIHHKLYAYFHERRLDIFAFQQNRFKFCNQFEAYRMRDALYFLLYVWKQLAFNAVYDELHLAGELPEGGELIKELKVYLKKVFVINPAADWGETAVTKTKGMPYDLMALLAKTR